MRQFPGPLPQPERARSKTSPTATPIGPKRILPGPTRSWTLWIKGMRSIGRSKMPWPPELRMRWPGAQLDYQELSFSAHRSRRQRRPRVHL